MTAPPPSFEHAERATLADGRVVWVRAVTPEDKTLLLEGFEKLSPESRYMRFFTAKHELSEQELRYLTELDGHDHFALGAVGYDGDGTLVPLGIARFIRSTHRPHLAEAAIVVADEAQGKGLGKLLLHRLSDAAYERDVRTFRCLVLADNVAMQGLLKELDPGARAVHTTAGQADIELSVPPTGEDAEARISRTSLERLLAQAARDTVTVRTSLREPPFEGPA